MGLLGAQWLSSVQSQTLLPAAHLPDLHWSPLVQGLPSSHWAVLAVLVQPVLGSQASVVQALLSSQSTLGSLATPRHLPLPQTSKSVHLLPSSQVPVLSLKLQPVSLLQPSVVQGLPSSQVVLPPAAHLPSLQASPLEHWSPSSHAAVLFLAVQPLWASQSSSVHSLLSSQASLSPDWQPPEAQTSLTVQASPSSQGC